MKVGVITRHAIANYGSILQSYATEKIFEKLGADVEIIDYVREEEKSENLVKTYTKNSKLWNKNFFTRLIYKIIQAPNLKKMEKEFKKNREIYLKMTEKQYKDFDQGIPEEDIYCTGSDQVWGQIANDEFDKNYFLDFVPKGKKCISYAASFGKSIISQELKENLPILLKKYSRILVREKSAVDILKDNNIDSNLVLDPTLLLDKCEWEKLYNEKYKIDGEYILVYQLHHNKEFDKYLKRVQKSMGIKVYRISPSYYFKFKPGNLIYLPSLEEFITLFHDAKCVITDSFHGTVFSIIFNIPMIDILPQKTGTRIESILQLFDIKNRILKDYNNIEIINEKINFKNINEKVKKERENSIKLLMEALEDKNGKSGCSNSIL